MRLPPRDRVAERRAHYQKRDEPPKECKPYPVTSDVAEFHDTIDCAGFDETRQLSPDPWGGNSSTGLRVPPATSVSLGGVAYRFLLCVADLDQGDAIIAMRLGVDLGAYLATDGGVPPLYPEIRPIITPLWHFVDGPYEFTLTKEPRAPDQPLRGPFDMQSFRKADARCALVYDTAGFPVAPNLPGYLGLNAYTPPGMRGHKVSVWRDVRAAWQSEQAVEVWRPADRPTRWRLYCDVWQHDPSAFPPPASTGRLGAVVEEQFLLNYPLAQYWRVYARMITRRKRRL
jgi:hypothetical protein